MSDDLLSEQEFDRLVTELESIGSFLPENKMPFLWDMANKIRKDNQPRPCACPSSAKLWSRAITELRDYTKRERKQ